MRTRTKNRELIGQRIMPSTRRKLVKLSQLDRRSPVDVLDVLIENALIRHGINPKTLKRQKNSTTHGGGSDGKTA